MKLPKWLVRSTGYAKPLVTPPPPPERLCPRGSVAKTCFGGREADSEQVEADEERSDRQERRVSPGEARALVGLRDNMLKEAASHEKLAEIESNPVTFMERRRHYAGLAAGLRHYADVLTMLAGLPEPDSDAPLGASGRRNDPAMARRAGDRNQIDG